ncbi:glycerate-2-kinase family protein [Qingshengfaniella alkalisoli]|uniref:glycerate-2-kinase family protein n=1 Tax=Qingshengfaniella alkalisoli TaxID=2599296 RepID=UPI001F0E7F85|nr:glycerate-2-kinase family protein [Qingshengfaniella alkalisoli]
MVGAGKSAATMARAVEHAWPDVALSDIVVTRYGHSVPTERIQVREAAHPVPDKAGQEATADILKTVGTADEGDLVLALISGGGSALLTAPVPTLTFDDKIDVTRRLLASGLPVAEMDHLRRWLSLVKGGGLARVAAPARLVTLATSDVPGDDSMAIASGSTVPCLMTISISRAPLNGLGRACPTRYCLRSPSGRNGTTLLRLSTTDFWTRRRCRWMLQRRWRSGTG